MSDALSGAEPKRSLLERLSALLLRAPEDREQLLSLLRTSHERDLLDAEALSMIEGVLQVAELAVHEIMVPRSRMDMIDISQPAQVFLPRVIRTGHSRFPVVDGERDNVIGILHAKDLLRLYTNHPPQVRELLRPAVFIPESKRLNVLLRDFRSTRQHIAIVVDEYGGVAGLISIEDVLEQIVGEIEDEFDADDTPVLIVPAEPGAAGPRFRVRAITEIPAFNEHFGTRFDHDDVDTIGGLLTEHFGRIPKRGDQAVLQGLRFEVLRADARKVHWLLVEPCDPPAASRAVPD